MQEKYVNLENISELITSPLNKKWGYGMSEANILRVFQLL